MIHIGDILGSSARTEILRVLVSLPGEAGVRYLATLAGIYPNSAEVAIRGLLHDKLIKKVKKGKRCFYGINRDHTDYSLLSAVFDTVSREHIRQVNKTACEKARMVFPFINQATRITQMTKRHES